MIILPEDVCNYILSFLPVKDPKYDQCIHQLTYLYGAHEEWRRQLKSHSFVGLHHVSKNIFVSLRRFILDKNRIKQDMGKPIHYSSITKKKMKEHRQKLRLQLIHQQNNTMIGDQWTIKIKT